MMGYELLIKLCNTVFPVERRLIVPKNITFKRLSDIIGLIFGWSENENHSFVMMDQPKIITSNQELYQKIKENNRLAKRNEKIHIALSKGIYIDEYFRLSCPMHYYCGTDLEWEHKIEVLGILDDYNDLYPKLISFQGENVACQEKGVSYYNEITYYKQNKIEHDIIKEIEEPLNKMNINLINIRLQASFFRRTLNKKEKGE